MPLPKPLNPKPSTCPSREVGTKGSFSIERRDAFGNRTPSRQGQVGFRCTTDGPGPVDVHIVDGAEGRSDIVASASVAGRYFLTVVGGDNQDPVPGRTCPTLLATSSTLLKSSFLESNGIL
jgi:hypothetical protein